MVFSTAFFSSRSYIFRNWESIPSGMCRDIFFTLWYSYQITFPKVADTNICWFLQMFVISMLLDIIHLKWYINVSDCANSRQQFWKINIMVPQFLIVMHYTVCKHDLIEKIRYFINWAGVKIVLFWNKETMLISLIRLILISLYIGLSMVANLDLPVTQVLGFRQNNCNRFWRKNKKEHKEFKKIHVKKWNKESKEFNKYERILKQFGLLGRNLFFLKLGQWN